MEDSEIIFAVQDSPEGAYEARAQGQAPVHAHDLELINAAADRLNAEALDALEYQAADEYVIRR